MEKVALNFEKREGKYIPISIDYFSRMVWARILETISAESVRAAITGWLDKGTGPIEIITDNKTEFDNEKLKRMCWDFVIEHISFYVL